LSKLIIDDLRVLDVPGDVVYARTPQKALEVLSKKKGKWEEVYLDHDLGVSWSDDGEEVLMLTIWPVIEYLESRIQSDPIKIDQVYVITSNPAGGQRMKLALDKMGYATTVMNPSSILTAMLPW
jgi:hypothetical protein